MFMIFRNNYEILKMLLDRGATIPIPHDVKCSCDDCVIGSADDSLKFSLARINAYRYQQVFWGR
jgi:Transient receptor ion channel II